MDYKAMYQDKLTTADEAVQKASARDEGCELPRRRAHARAGDFPD